MKDVSLIELFENLQQKTTLLLELNIVNNPSIKKVNFISTTLEDILDVLCKNYKLHWVIKENRILVSECTPEWRTFSFVFLYKILLNLLILKWKE